MPKLILDLCAGTGAWSQPYEDDPAYRVVRITYPDYDVTRVVITERIVFFQSLNGKPDIEIPLVRIHGILAAPPCTEFSLANTRQAYALRPAWKQGLIVVEACERIIRAAMCKGYLRFWALENPFGHLRKFLGIPRLTFEAWWYDPTVPWVKKTDLWGYFLLPKRIVPEEDRPIRLENGERDEWRHQPGWYTPSVPERYAHMALDRAAIRAITPSGFATAFAKANR
jgi:hypothetical protein